MSGRISLWSNFSPDRRRSASEVKISENRSPIFNPSFSLDDRDSGDAESLVYSSGSSLDSLSDEYDPILVLDDVNPLSRRRPRPVYPPYLHPTVRSLDSEDECEDVDYAMMSETERRWRRVDRQLESVDRGYDGDRKLEIADRVFESRRRSSGSSLSSSPR